MSQRFRTHLEAHDTALPSVLLGGGAASAEEVGVHVPIACIGVPARLADDEPVVREFDNGGVGGISVSVSSGRNSSCLPVLAIETHFFSGTPFSAISKMLVCSYSVALDLKRSVSQES